MTQRILPAVLIVVGAAYLWFALEIPLDPWSEAEAINSRTLPMAYGVILMVLCLPLLLRGVSIELNTKRLSRLGLIGAAIAGFAVLLPAIGIWPALMALLIVSLLIMGERRVWLICSAPVATGLLGWIIIEWGLGIYLEPGYLWS